MTSVYRSVLLAIVAAAAVFAAENPIWDGTWKLNVAKSKFQSPARKAHTLVLGNGIAKSEETMADGTQRKWSHKTGTAQDTPITGIPNSSVTAKETGRTIEHTWKMGNDVSTGKGVVSDDGKTITYTLSGKLPDGTAFKDVMIFEKQ